MLGQGKNAQSRTSERAAVGCPHLQTPASDVSRCSHAGRRALARRAIAAGLVWASILGTGIAGAAQPASVNPITREALALCNRADEISSEERAAVLERGVDRAEQAVRADPNDPVAHFAVFCNLGKRLQMDRSRAFTAFGEIGRMRQEIDIALTLAPDYPAALAAKGEMLIELPRLLGGDPREGRRLLRRAVQIDPADRRVREMLTEAVKASGESDETATDAAS
jgi:cytochrome c-type biogenesis protein CcmH/NrfG